MLETLRAYGLERLAESGSPRPRADWPGMRCRWRAGRGPDMQASPGELAGALTTAKLRWLWPTCVMVTSASRTRLRRRSGFARPYILSLIILMRLTWPSTAPEL